MNFLDWLQSEKGEENFVKTEGDKKVICLENKAGRIGVLTKARLFNKRKTRQP